MRNRVFHLFLLLLSISQMKAQDVYVVDTLYPVHWLDDHLLIYPDPQQRYTIEEMVQDTNLQYQPRAHFPKHLDPFTAYWGKVKLRSDSDLKGWMLHLEDRYFRDMAWVRGNGKVDVFAFANGELLFHKKTGSNYLRAEKEIPKPYNLNRVFLPIEAGTTMTVFLRVQGNVGGLPPFFNVSLRAPGHEFYHPYTNFHEFFRTFILGVCFIIFLYHLLQFIYLRQAVFFWFSLWVGVCTLVQGMADAYFSEWLIGDLGGHRFTVWMAVANCTLFTFWFFGRSFFDSKEKFPKLDKVILAYSLVLAFEVVIMVSYLIWGDLDIWYGKVGHHYKWVIISSIFGLGLAVYITFLKDPFARYFGLGAILATGAILLGGLWSERLIRLQFEPYSLGIFLQIIAYSFGIAYRQQQLSKTAQEERLAAEKSKAEVQRIRDLDEIKSRFFANISHEFRTPLSLILGPIQQTKNKTISNTEEQPIMLSAKAFSVIKNNARRLQNLVDQLLDLSKIESGHVHLSLTQGGLVKFIRSVVFSFESMAERQNISLNASFPSEVETAFYDKDKLEKIISNLLSNAFKYTPQGGAVTITVQTDPKYFIIEVSDTGKGINKEDVKRIFERFYRVEGSEEKGSGIGLALTKELVDLHNGQISVSSTKGKGTTFKVRMPHSPTDLPESISVVSQNENAEQETNFTKIEKETVVFETGSSNGHTTPKNLPVALVVEDNADLRHFIADILHSQFKVLTAVDGMQGERMAFEHIPDIIISDVMMPKKDGYALCHSLKTNQKTSHIPVVMLTAKAGQSNKMEGLTQGADAYLTKPFNADELLLRMKNLIEARRKIWEHFQSSDLTIIPGLDITSMDNQFLQEVTKAIMDNLDNELLSVEDIARAVGFSRSQLHRKLKALTDKSANQLIVEIRLNEARRMLENKAGSVSEIAYSVGYSNMSYFTKSFKERFGVLPSKI